jgi:hypothetical protein
MMNDCVELTALIDKPVARRLWLLSCALQSLPLHRAIDLARAAEVFIMGSSLGNKARIGSDPPLTVELERAEQEIGETGGEFLATNEPIATKPTRSALPVELRNRVLDRLAEGAPNGEVAAEFGLTSKQVQGVRMGCAREIAQRRDKLGKSAHPDQSSGQIVSVEDVIRFLRQRDDVVVPQENGEFLVNGRFRMRFEELLARANRIRAREGKSKFGVAGSTTVHPEMSQGNRHPLFWDVPLSTTGRSNGSHQPAEIETEGA